MNYPTLKIKRRYPKKARHRLVGYMSEWTEEDGTLSIQLASMGSRDVDRNERLKSLMDALVARENLSFRITLWDQILIFTGVVVGVCHDSDRQCRVTISLNPGEVCQQLKWEE